MINRPLYTRPCETSGCRCLSANCPVVGCQLAMPIFVNWYVVRLIRRVWDKCTKAPWAKNSSWFPDFI